MSQQPLLAMAQTSVHLTMTVSADDISTFLTHLKPAFDATVLLPECIYFEVFQNPAKPGQFRLVENWTVPFGWLTEVQPFPRLQDSSI